MVSPTSHSLQKSLLLRRCQGTTRHGFSVLSRLKLANKSNHMIESLPRLYKIRFWILQHNQSSCQDSCICAHVKYNRGLHCVVIAAPQTLQGSKFTGYGARAPEIFCVKSEHISEFGVEVCAKLGLVTRKFTLNFGSNGDSSLGSVRPINRIFFRRK